MLTWYLHNIVQLFEPLSTVNTSIRIKRNDISKKETKKKIEIFEKYQKNPKSQVTWPHNGQKKYFRFFGVRISQFEKINEKKNSKILKFFKKILSLRSRDLIMGKFRIKIFLLHFWNQNGSIRTKKQKKFFQLSDPRGLTIWRHQNGMWPD